MRLFLKSFWIRFILIGLAAVGAASVTFFLVARTAQPDYRPVDAPLSLELSAAIDKIPKYRRPQESTYLTFPEWYLVFCPQEYAQFLHGNPPSKFPYFASIGQFWRGYAQVYGITHRAPFNFGNHLMVMVIGTSSTVEYAIKGVYENTVGRLFEWTGSGANTPEDIYATEVAREYGDFIPTQPWFDFPFGHKLAGLWTKTDFFGPNFLRKCERKFFLSLEYSVKSVYAGVIRIASHSVYGVADTEVYASVNNIPDQAFDNSGVKKVSQLGEHAWIITLPHYEGFTETVPGLAAQGVQFHEIAGNSEILLTLVAPFAWRYDLAAGKELFTMELLTGPSSKRVAIQVPVKSLGGLLRETQAKGLRIEHLFDY